jgi:hypothetical protein
LVVDGIIGPQTGPKFEIACNNYSSEFDNDSLVKDISEEKEEKVFAKKRKKNKRVCKDTRALNFNPNGKHDEKVCYYPWG